MDPHRLMKHCVSSLWKGTGIWASTSSWGRPPFFPAYYAVCFYPVTQLLHLRTIAEGGDVEKRSRLGVHTAFDFPNQQLVGRVTVVLSHWWARPVTNPRWQIFCWSRRKSIFPLGLRGFVKFWLVFSTEAYFTCWGHDVYNHFPDQN